MISRAVGYDFQKGAKAPRWNTFLQEIFDNDQEVIRWIQCLLGMGMTGYTGHQFVVFMTRTRIQWKKRPVGRR